jgi:hypothetical protein
MINYSSSSIAAVAAAASSSSFISYSTIQPSFIR